MFQPAPGREPTPRELQGLYALARAIGSKPSFPNRSCRPRAWSPCCEDLGLRLFVLDPLGGADRRRLLCRAAAAQRASHSPGRSSAEPMHADSGSQGPDPCASASFPALDRVSFTIEKQEIIAVIGPNGSGKTTLLKAILGLVPCQGEIHIFGTSRRARSCRRWAMCRSTSPLKALSPDRRGIRQPHLPHAGKAPSGGALLDEAGMAEFKDKLIGELSGGQLQRVLLAHAMLHRPRSSFWTKRPAASTSRARADFYSTIQRLNREHGVTV